jgi:hypothetical protein
VKNRETAAQKISKQLQPLEPRPPLLYARHDHQHVNIAQDQALEMLVGCQEFLRRSITSTWVTEPHVIHRHILAAYLDARMSRHRYLRAERTEASIPVNNNAVSVYMHVTGHRRRSAANGQTWR